MDIHIDYDAIAVSLETDESGSVTAYNDELRVMAIGPDADTARARFRDALVHQVTHEPIAGRPLPDDLRSRILVA